MVIADAKTLGEQIRTARKAQGLTQEQLAASAGAGTRFIRELERGKPTIQLEKALAVLKMLGLELTVSSLSETP